MSDLPVVLSVRRWNIIDVIRPPNFAESSASGSKTPNRELLFGKHHMYASLPKTHSFGNVQRVVNLKRAESTEIKDSKNFFSKASEYTIIGANPIGWNL